MLRRRLSSIAAQLEIITQNFAPHTNNLNHPFAWYSTVATGAELPRKLKRDERKPWVTSINELKRKARLERKDRQLVRERILRPPENGLLAKKLIPVAHKVYAARDQLFKCVSRVVKSIAVYSCR